MTITTDRALLYLVIAGLIYLVFKDCNGKTEIQPNEKETTTTETVDYRTIINEAVNNALAKQTPDTRPYIIYPNNTVKEVQNIKDVNAADLSKVRNLNVYKDTTKVENGVIYSEIGSDGKVYFNNTRAELKEKIVTKTITEKTTINGSGLFIEAGAFVNGDMKLNTVNAGLNYIYKNDVSIGGGVIFDTGTKNTYYGLKIGKKIL